MVTIRALTSPAPDLTVVRATQGDPRAQRDLLLALGPLVYTLCRRLTPDADDAYQEIWAKVFVALPRFDVQGSASIRTWVATIARRHLIDRHRRRSVRGEVVPLHEESLPAEGPSAVDRLAERRRVLRLEAALERLSDSQRRVVVLHHLHGVALAELARDEGVEIGTIKSRLHRGRARLAELLGGNS